MRFQSETDHGLSEIVKRADVAYAMKRAMKQAAESTS